MSVRWKKALLAAVVAIPVAAMTLYRLGDTPPGLYMDEAAIALTARSLWETGRDLAGTTLPLFPLSYPDIERPMPVNPLFTYGAIPFALAGPGAWSARLPAVLWLWIAAAGIGLCANEITRRWEVGLAIGATSALCPWLFVLGRVGWEAVSYPAVTSFALWFLFRGFRTGRGGDFAASGALLGASVYAYSTARLLAPLTALAFGSIVALGPITRRHTWRLLLPFAVFAAPLGVVLTIHPGLLTWRTEELGIWSDGGSASETLHRFLINYGGYLSPRFLFLSGDPNLRHGTGRGVLLWMWAPLIALGLWRAWRRRGEPAAQVIMTGLILAPVAASLLVHGQPHAIRSIVAAVFWAALAALGLDQLLLWTVRRRGAAIAMVLAVALEVGPFANDYFGAYRGRAGGQFDAGAGAALREAFALRGERPVYVPADLLEQPRRSVLIAYWGGLPLAAWRERGSAALGIHAWHGEAPAGGIIVTDGAGQTPPPGARLVYPPAPGTSSRYAVYEVGPEAGP